VTRIQLGGSENWGFPSGMGWRVSILSCVHTVCSAVEWRPGMGRGLVFGAIIQLCRRQSDRAEQLQGAPPYTGALRRHWYWNMVLLNSGFHRQKSENYPQFGHSPLAIFSPKGFEGFKGHQIISLAGSPTCLGPAVFFIKHFFTLPNRLMTWDKVCWRGR